MAVLKGNVGSIIGFWLKITNSFELIQAYFPFLLEYLGVNQGLGRSF